MTVVCESRMGEKLNYWNGIMNELVHASASLPFTIQKLENRGGGWGRREDDYLEKDWDNTWILYGFNISRSWIPLAWRCEALYHGRISSTTSTSCSLQSPGKFKNRNNHERRWAKSKLAHLVNDQISKEKDIFAWLRLGISNGWSPWGGCVVFWWRILNYRPVTSQVGRVRAHKKDPMLHPYLVYCLVYILAL